MKKESIGLYILRLAVTLLLITAVVAGALAAVNAITKDKIDALKAEKTQKALAAVLSDAATAEQLEGFPNEAGLVQAVYQSETGYAIQVAPNGFGGPVNMMVGVDKEGTILGISVVSHTETAGLGAIAGDKTSKGEAFRGQFQGLSGDVAVTKDGGTVDSISGATITSRAVTIGVNAATQCVLALENNQG